MARDLNPQVVLELPTRQDNAGNAQGREADSEVVIEALQELDPAFQAWAERMRRKGRLADYIAWVQAQFAGLQNALLQPVKFPERQGGNPPSVQ